MLNVTFLLLDFGSPTFRVSRLWVTLPAVAGNVEARAWKSWSWVVTMRSRKLGEDIFAVKWLRKVGGRMEVLEQTTVSIFSSKRCPLRS